MPGEEREPRRDRQLGLRVGEHAAPLGGLRRAAAEAEERQRRGLDDGGRQLRVACTITGPMAFGSTWLIVMVPRPSPSVWAEST